MHETASKTKAPEAIAFGAFLLDHRQPRNTDNTDAPHSQIYTDFLTSCFLPPASFFSLLTSHFFFMEHRYATDSNRFLLLLSSFYTLLPCT